MTDSDILKIALLKNGNIKNVVVTLKYLNNHQDFANYLKNRYHDIPDEMFTYREVIWRIKYEIETRPVCKACGRPVRFIGKSSWEKKGKTVNGYLVFCCQKCSNNDEQVKQKVRATSLERYGEKRSAPRKKFENTMLLRYGVKNALQNEEILNKAKGAMLEHYGVSSPAKSDIVKEKIKETNIKKYGYVAPACSNEILEKIKKTNQLKYGADCYFKSQTYKRLRKNNQKKWVEKAINTALKNGTRYSSKPEKKLYELLCLIFGEDNIIRQHKTNDYPFLCDFYLKKEDIYIEYNGTYIHNDCLYDEIRDKEKRLKLLEKCSDSHPTYQRTYDVWTKNDVNKYKRAKEKNLNFIFIYKYWDEDWLKFTKGRVTYSDKKILAHLKELIEGQISNKCVKIIGEKYD